ncbi:hypothetical protein [Sediminicola luteus]|uniref:O-antigen polymerase n=1 Tax=Sediminicola luteus TaxID=319238 RepID=A0ABV2U0J8_9FLAO
MSKFLKNCILIGIFLVTLYSINSWTDLPVGNTTIWWAVFILILIAFVLAKNKFYDKVNDSNIIFIKLYLFWNIVCIVRGLFVAQDYWEWKFLTQTSIVLLLPLSIFISTNTFVVQTIVGQWIKYVFPAFFIFYFFMHAEAVGHYLIPVSFLLLFFPFLNSKWKILAVSIVMVVLASNLGARSNVIKFMVPIALSLLYYFKSLINIRLISLARIILLGLPIVFLVLALTNTFNVFKMSEYIEGNYKLENKSTPNGGREDLTSDTRTFLYIEVINSALKYDYVWLGRTPARGNESPSFGPQIDKDLKTKKMERHSNEVSILNIFTWTGIVGVLLYFFVFFKASFLAIKKSNSWFMKLLGIYISFRWAYAWVEDFSTFNLSYLFLWITIGMCFSTAFREMTDLELKNWVRGIFDKRYRQAILKLQLAAPHKV